MSGHDHGREYAKWDDRVRAHLAARAADPGWTAYVLGLWEHHLESGFVKDHFVRELTKGEDGPFFQRIWEMMVGRHMLGCGFNVVSPSQDGRPDFRCEKDGCATWVEASCITAGQDPALAPDADWLCSSGHVPLENILLRWANALDAKIKQAKAHRAAGIIAPKDRYIIAINGGLIAAGNYGFGVSRHPFVVETTMAVGALQFSYDRETLAFKGAAHQVRTHALKENKSTVQTAVFYNKENAGICALVGCGSLRVEGPSLPLLVAHNPHAECPIPPGHLGACTREWTAHFTGRDVEASYWEIVEITEKSSTPMPT